MAPFDGGPFLEADGQIVDEEHKALRAKYNEYDRKTLDHEMTKKEKELFGLYEEGCDADGNFKYDGVKSFEGNANEKRRRILLINSELSAMHAVDNELERIKDQKEKYEKHGSFRFRPRREAVVEREPQGKLDLYGMLEKKRKAAGHDNVGTMLSGSEGSIILDEKGPNTQRVMAETFGRFLHPDYLEYAGALFQTSDGMPPPEQRLPRIEDAVQAGIEFLPIIPTMPVGSQDANYLKETVTTGADVKAEGESFQEGDVSYNEETLHFSHITYNIPVTEIQLRETPIARRLLNRRAPAEVLIKLEKDVLLGGGGTNVLKGLVGFAWPNRAANTQATAGEYANRGTTFDWIKELARARLNVRRTGFVAPSHALVSQDLWFYMTTKLLAGDRYALPPATVPAVLPVMSVWGMRVVESTRFAAEAAGSINGIVGAFSSKLTLYMRDSLDVRWGMSGDDFVQAKIRVRASIRAALEMTRPQAFTPIQNSAN